MPRIQSRCNRILGNRRGIAFPLALLGLLIVSGLVTAVLLSASTESAIGGAQRDATHALHTASGGIEAYLAETGVGLVARPRFTYTPPGGSPAEVVDLAVTRISVLDNGNPDWPDDETFLVQATPSSGNHGRTIGAFTRLTSQVLTIGELTGVWTGSDITLRGNAKVSDGSDADPNLCDPALAARNALEHAAGTEVSIKGNVKIEGDTATSAVRPRDFVETYFGTTLEGLIAMADIKFSARTDGTNYTVKSSPGRADPNNPMLTRYNWGCPAGMNAGCEGDSDVDWMPIVAIDASDRNGGWGSVTINMSHGQGMLIVYNGSVRIQGAIVYKGVILTEGSFDLHGTGNNGAKLEGALIGLGMGPGGQEFILDQDIQGTPTVRFNACAIQALRDKFEEENKYARVVVPTFGWFEVVR